ncbi:MAG: ABC transporter ATP-binding protein [Synergistaceae bacterium]|nr:ABC transporter ATP-binding protein [Synergistaceae bacterium]
MEKTRADGGRQAILEIQGLEVVYRTEQETVRAVNGIDLSIHEGETVGLVGETGAGKTTTALSILRLLPEKTGRILRGEILLRGRNLLNVPEKEMRKAIRGDRISMIFQDPMSSLNPVMRVGDQIAEALKYHNDTNMSSGEIQSQVDKMLELVGISPARKRDYPHQFSGGMKQRVVIATALACNPELLIADEPTTALDVTIQAQVLALMSELQNKFRSAILLITHDLGIVAQTCSRVAVMYAGEIIESGTVEDVFLSDKRHPYTVGLFGSIPDMNAEADRLSPIGGLMPDPTALPDGCYFSTRCPLCRDICRESHPDVTVDGTHEVLCHLYAEERL